MTCTWSGSWCDAMLAGFVVVVSFFSQVWLLSCLSSSLCKNSNEFYVGFVYSSLLVFWTPTCRAESIFATTAFSQLMMLLLSERGFAVKVDVLAKPVFPFYLFSISKSVIFFSPVVLEICITTGRIFYFTTKRKITSIHYNMKRKKERKEPKWWQESFLICYSWVVCASDLSPFIKFLHCHS